MQLLGELLEYTLGLCGEWGKESSSLWVAPGCRAVRLGIKPMSLKVQALQPFIPQIFIEHLRCARHPTPLHSGADRSPPAMLIDIDRGGK